MILKAVTSELPRSYDSIEEFLGRPAFVRQLVYEQLYDPLYRDECSGMCPVCHGFIESPHPTAVYCTGDSVCAQVGQRAARYFATRRRDAKNPHRRR